VIPEEARDLDTAYDLIVAAADDNELWDAIATALIEARNEGRCQPAEETA
jgi:siroheme synthase (precorrin-2 oxidase/ferrochelatase)